MNEFEELQRMYLLEERGIQVSDTAGNLIGLWAFVTMMLGIGLQLHWAVLLLKWVALWLA